MPWSKFTRSRKPRTTPVQRPRETVLRRLNRWQAEEQREDLADLYVECCPSKPGQEFPLREAFIERLVADARTPGFSMRVAETATLTGFAFGVPLERDGSWWQGFEGVLPQYLEQLTASGHVFAISELVVHPYAREHGVASRLVERVLADNQASLAVTLVDQADPVINAALQSWGWRRIGLARSGPGTGRLRMMVLPLAGRSGSEPGALVHNTHTQRPRVT